eukprot:1157280-Pelagomonas_calceolata.AAC.2
MAKQRLCFSRTSHGAQGSWGASNQHSPASTPDYDLKDRRTCTLEPAAFLNLCAPAQAIMEDSDRGPNNAAGPFKAHRCALFEDCCDGGWGMI